MVENLQDRRAAWLTDRGDDADIVLNSQCRLVRNMADFPFPNQCNPDERRSVQERMTTALEQLNLLASGTWCSVAEMDTTDAAFLAERRLISRLLATGEGARGAYVAEDQSLSISVNDENHVTLVALASGQQLQETWARVNLVDDTVGGAIDFAFDERLGYLTTSIYDLGTGLKVETVLHLPALEARGEIDSVTDLVTEKRHRLEPMYGTEKEVLGDLYRLTNTSTLGRSEEEIVFHVKHLAGEIVNREREARKTLKEDTPVELEDRVWRAVGMARRARLLTLNESFEVLSSMRLGVALGYLDHYTLEQINEALIAAQNAHIELRCGQECDELTLNTERAEMFRARFN